VWLGLPLKRGAMAPLPGRISAGLLLLDRRSVVQHRTGVLLLLFALDSMEAVPSPARVLGVGHCVFGRFLLFSAA